MLRPREGLRGLLILFAAASAASAGGYLDGPGEEKTPKPFFFLEGAMNLNGCPQAAAYYEFAHSWQAGVEARSWLFRADAAYDYIPEFDAHLRKLWLGSEEGESLRNSEYVEISAGAYPSYRFLGLETLLTGADEPRQGLRPQARLTLGKYWMPFFPAGPGLDIGLSLGHYFLGGHPPGYPHPDYATVTLSLFFHP